jgi:hypothetical protein
MKGSAGQVSEKGQKGDPGQPGLQGQPGITFKENPLKGFVSDTLIQTHRRAWF